MGKSKENRNGGHENESELTAQKRKIDKIKITVTSNEPSSEAIENFNRELNRIAQERYYR
ncbi:hypothetical protein [Aerococcus viridans]|uniref:hypothetical protein n=1 Tax=Aerococcus viridans TaxID=1377 RepID=UPI002DBB979F|nr:hypothetical protein [Aerococcus viridans]MEC1386510.1 hypothetical protein [Aerococcus viridans]